MSNEFWVLYDPRNKTQTEKMTTEETQFSLMKMKTKEINNFLIWRSQWEKWKKLKEFLTSDNSPFMSTFLSAKDDNSSENQPSSLKMKPVDKETEKNIMASFSNVQLEEVNLSEQNNSTGEGQFDADQLSNETSTEKPSISFKNLDVSNALGKSNTKNDKYKIELLLIHPKGNMFRTIAKDISLSGTFSEKIVPDEFHHSTFDLVIINNFIPDVQLNRLTLKSKIVVTNSSVYLEYVNATDQQKETLRAILDYYVRSLKKLNS